MSFISGLAVKTVDSSVEHGLKLNKYFRYSLSLLYGAILSYLISSIFLPEFFLGILIGVIAARKIDSKEHFFGIISFAVFSFFFKPVISQWIMVFIISLVCYFEEWVNDNVVDKKKVKGLFLKFLSIRPILEIAAIVLSVIYSNFSIFFLLLFFDLGYLFSSKFIKKMN